MADKLEPVSLCEIAKIVKKECSFFFLLYTQERKLKGRREWKREGLVMLTSNRYNKELEGIRLEHGIVCLGVQVSHKYLGNVKPQNSGYRPGIRGDSPL